MSFCVAVYSWNALCKIHTSPTCIWRRTWNDLRLRSVYHNPTRALPLLFLLLSYRKHALNCHRMKPALFSVLCEIKEKTGESVLHSFFLFSSLHKLRNIPNRCSSFSPSDLIDCICCHSSNAVLFFVLAYMMYKLNLFWPLSRFYSDYLKLIIMDWCLLNWSNNNWSHVHSYLSYSFLFPLWNIAHECR